MCSAWVRRELRVVMDPQGSSCGPDSDQQAGVTWWGWRGRLGFSAQGLKCKVAGKPWKVTQQRMCTCPVVHLKNLSASFYEEGEEQGRKASLVAVQESNDGAVNWEVTAEVTEEDGLEQSFGGRLSRTWEGTACWEEEEVRGKGQGDPSTPTPPFSFAQPFSSVSPSWEKMRPGLWDSCCDELGPGSSNLEFCAERLEASGRWHGVLAHCELITEPSYLRRETSYFHHGGLFITALLPCTWYLQASH